MRRREFITLLGGAATWPVTARAQQGTQQTKIYRIGFLFAGTIALRPEAQEFWRTLQELGYIEGKNYTPVVREAKGEVSHLPSLASEIVDANPDVIVPVTTPAAVEAKKATQTIPIVMAIIADPLGSGLVKSLGRPEANITGPSLLSTELTSKRVQLLKEIIPELSNLGVLWRENTPVGTTQAKLAEEATGSLGMSLRSFPIKTFSEVAAAFDKAFEEQLKAMLVTGDALLYDRRSDIIALSSAKRIATFHTFPEEALDGAVAAYGASLAREYRRSALYVDKILRGAAPHDLPVDQSTVFDFALNLRTAKAIGLKISESIILRADKVVE